MKIWLINPYGPIPGEGWRDYSFTMFGTTLAAAGHNVTWWTSNFSHHFKTYRSPGWEDRAVSANFTIRLVPTSSYRKNIGLGRIIRDIVFAVRTTSRGKNEPRPDCILYYESPLTFGYAAPALAKYHKFTLIYDQMDLWPELIVKSAPRQLQSILNFLFTPVYATRRRVFNKLDGTIALAKPYLESVLSEIYKSDSIPCALIYNGIDVDVFRTAMHQKTIDIEKPATQKWAIFAGSLGPSYDIKNLISTAENLKSKNSNVTILIAGDGPLRNEVTSAAQKLENLRYLGKLPPHQLAQIYGLCDIGLSAYTSASNVEMPDKFYDYTAAGLAILNSLRGEVAEWISNHQIGFTYDPNIKDDLAAKLHRLASDATLLEEMKSRSYQLGTFFDMKQQSKNLAIFLENTVQYSEENKLTRTPSP